MYAGSLFALGSAGVGLSFARRAWAWRVELVSLLGVSLLWAGFLVIALRSTAIGHDCSEVHHEGELPMLIATLAWVGALAVTLRRMPSESRLLIRLVPVLGTAAVVVGTIYVLLTVRPAC